MRIDLNLLTVIDAIMAESSLTRAAKRLDKTQSAVSHSLTRLRELTGDPLFERTGRGVRPTPRAQAMAVEVRQALSILQCVVEGRAVFDPVKATRAFLVDIPGGFDWLLAPRLADRLESMPGITVHISNARAAHLLTELSYRETLLALDYAPMTADGYKAETLLESELVLVARTDHPKLRRGLKADDLRTLGQVGISWASTTPGSHPVDERIEQAGLPRPVRLWVPTLASMMAVVQSSDLVGYCAAPTAKHFARLHAIQLHHLPIQLRPVPLIMVWHESCDTDAGHRWLRETIRDICRQLP